MSKQLVNFFYRIKPWNLPQNIIIFFFSFMHLRRYNIMYTYIMYHGVQIARRVEVADGYRNMVVRTGDRDEIPWCLNLSALRPTIVRRNSVARAESEQFFSRGLSHKTEIAFPHESRIQLFVSPLIFINTTALIIYEHNLIVLTMCVCRSLIIIV